MFCQILSIINIVHYSLFNYSFYFLNVCQYINIAIYQNTISMRNNNDTYNYNIIIYNYNYILLYYNLIVLFLHFHFILHSSFFLFILPFAILLYWYMGKKIIRKRQIRFWKHQMNNWRMTKNIVHVGSEINSECQYSNISI